MKRTTVAEPDADFIVAIPITKSYVDTKTGERHIIGVATGVAEDRDGERCSKNCVVGMGRDIQQGGVKVTSSHQQDWMTEIGDVAKYEYDPETDEMSVDGVLPPEGVDPIADKAWTVANKERVGWSIGGKLLQSYFERNETGKKRKVLDAIKLKHICLTKNPAYPNSFAEAVAKTWSGDVPADDEFILDSDDVDKDTSTGSWVSGSSDAGGGNVGRDSVGSGQRNAGTRKPDAKSPSTEDPSGKGVPQTPSERTLACPHCGHEFAADLPTDPNEMQNDDNPDDKDSAKASAEKTLMETLTETLDTLKALAAEDEVAKTDEPAAEDTPVEPVVDEAPAEPVAKADDTKVDEVAKMVAASHKHHEDRLDSMEKTLSEAFDVISKNQKQLVDLVASMPLGRKSTARILPPPNGHEADGEKSVEKQIEEAPDALTALKIQNEALYGIH